jgi:hypothetical protein
MEIGFNPAEEEPTLQTGSSQTNFPTYLNLKFAL